MEYTQWDGKEECYWGFDCLNPCCNGIYSMSLIKAGAKSVKKS